MCQTTRPRGWDSADSDADDDYDNDKYWYTDDEEEYEREREYQKSDYHFVDRLLGDMLFKNGTGMAGRGEGGGGGGEGGGGRGERGGGRGEGGGGRGAREWILYYVSSVVTAENYGFSTRDRLSREVMCVCVCVCVRARVRPHSTNCSVYVVGAGG